MLLPGQSRRGPQSCPSGLSFSRSIKMEDFSTLSGNFLPRSALDRARSVDCLVTCLRQQNPLLLCSRCNCAIVPTVHHIVRRLRECGNRICSYEATLDRQYNYACFELWQQPVWFRDPGVQADPDRVCFHRYS